VREKIWGQLAHYGFSDLAYGTSKAGPWRAAANENTTIEFSSDVTIEGKPLSKGKYGFFIALFAIYISYLGLFGLASFIAEQRTKEIGIRKVLGVSVLSLWKMLSKDFVVLVLISCTIAVPIASYFMERWLQKYEYSIEISWWVFGVAILGVLSITILTISFQAIKAANANPVKSLRAE